MTEGQVHLTVSTPAATVVFDRPAARNAMTWRMYDELAAICEQLKNDSTIRSVVFRGAGGHAFVAGTDIAQFQAFKDGEDGVAYERRIDHCIGLIEGLPMVTLAMIEGLAAGGGLAIATACDFRLATSPTLLGVPIARTVGNTLSMANLVRLQAAFGTQRVKRMLLSGEMIDAREALACGYLDALCEEASVDRAVADWCARMGSLAPVTQRVIKEGMRRIVMDQIPDGDDLVRQSYASADFREGVAAFLAKRTPVWRGR